jgi:hypothetical protein
LAAATRLRSRALDLAAGASRTISGFARLARSRTGEGARFGG